MIESLVNNFRVGGKFVEAELFGSGHINETYLVIVDQDGIKTKYILRKININVFRNPVNVINNTEKITNHIKRKLEESKQTDIRRNVVNLVKTKDQKYYYLNKDNEYWCMLYFIDNAHTIDDVKTTNQAYQAAKAFGNFVYQLNDLETSKIKDTIPNFHNLEIRLRQFDDAVEKNIVSRVKTVSVEIRKVNENRNLSSKILQLFKTDLPHNRIIHNDTKISNVMLDNKTGKSLAVVDLDTVMLGTILYDFGDMVRSYTNSAQEDGKDINRVKMRIEIFESIVQGYLSQLKSILTKPEIDNLVLGAEVIVFEQAVRFLTDYIVGDVYYSTKYDEHNLIRAKNQFALLNSIFEQKNEMIKIIKKYS